MFDPKKWEKPTPGEMLDFIEQHKSQAKQSGNSLLVFRKHLSPLSVYKYLSARFGRPYGFLTMARNPNDSDNLFHWDYLIKADGVWIQIAGGNRDIHVSIFGKSMTSKDWVSFAKALKGDFQRLGSEMSRVGSTLEKWSVVPNRFSMIADACAGFHEILVNNNNPPDFEPSKRRSASDIDKYGKRIKKLGERAQNVFSASLSLDLMTPVLAEAFINLIIFIMRKDELKKNSRHYDYYIRQSIDARVFDLHLKCNHFKDGVNPESEEYKAFKRVMDRRNYILHGNIDPVRDLMETVYFDKFTPVFESGSDPVLDLFRKKESIIDIPGVLERYHNVHAFFSYILSLIEEKARVEIQIMAEDSMLGYDLSRNRPGRLFSSLETMMVMPLKYDDELNVKWR